MAKIADFIRVEEHTGNNRCAICTVLNVLLLAITVLLANLISPLLASILLLFGGLCIWLRGYLVPLTPTFAPIIVNKLRQDTQRDQRLVNSTVDTELYAREKILEELISAGVIQPEGEELTLNDCFEADWYSAMNQLNALEDEEIASEIIAVNPMCSNVELQKIDDRDYVIQKDTSGKLSGERWTRKPVAIVESAALQVFRDWNIESDTRPVAAYALGLFLHECPLCGDEIRTQPDTGCCGSPDTGPDGEILHVRVCGSCEAKYHVIPSVSDS